MHIVLCAVCACHVWEQKYTHLNMSHNVCSVLTIQHDEQNDAEGTMRKMLCVLQRES